MRLTKALRMSVLALTLPLIAIAASPQNPGSSIRGVVVTRDGGSPLSGVTVELQSPAAPTMPARITTTDDDGKFVLSRVPAGSYRVLFRRSGFVSMQHGQRGINSPGALLVVGNDPAPDLRMAMTATGSISGRVTTKEARPMANARVRALRASYREGQRVLTDVKETLSDDTGEYRLFGLPPGQYFVSVTVPDGPSGAPLLMNPDGNDVRGLYEGRAQLFPVATISIGSGALDNEAHIPIFFPGTGNGSLARPIDVAPAANVRGIDISALPLRTRRVRGTLSNGAPGQPPGANAQVRLLPVAANSGPQYQATADPSTGAFDFPKVVPGSYVVYATVGGANGTRGQTALEVRDQDIDNISLVTTPGFTLPFQIQVEDPAGATTDLTPFRLSLRPDPAIAGMFAPSGVPSNGNITGILNGGYRLYVTPLLTAPAGPNPAIPAQMQNLYVKSARLDALDILNNGLKVDGQPAGQLDIVIGKNPGRVSGRVAPATEGVRVVLVPDEGRGFRTDAYKSAFTDAAGQFQFTRIPPGAYHLYAWEDVANDAWLDPDFMRAQEERGNAVVIREGNNTDVSVSVIPLGRD